jgi:anti-anti-sigma factor
MRSVIVHLLAMNHRRIAFVGWEGNPDMPARMAGYRQALEAHGIPFDPSLVYMLAGGWSTEGAEAAQRLIAAGLPCTAVAFAGDNLALGAMRAFQRAGVRIPQDLAMTGFDDMPEAQIATPPLTTVRMRFDAMSRAAAEHLLDIVAGAPPAAEPIVIPMSLVVRRSAGERLDRLEAAPGGESADRRSLAQRLAETVGAPEVLAPGELPQRLWPGVGTMVEAVESTLRPGAALDDSVLQQAWASAIAVSSYADPLEDAVGQIEAELRAELADLPPDAPARRRADGAIHRLRVMLLRASVGGQVERINRSELALSFSDTAARTLADSDLETACGLGWLEHSGVTAAALGLWDAQTQRRLHIAGRYSVAAEHDAASIVAPLFPPTELIGAAQESPITILPLRSARREWGFLAIALPESLETSAFDSAPLLAALLTARIDSATLQQEREVQQADLRTAYERERALAETVRELGCPIIPLSESTLLAPLIGMIDSQRAEQIVGTLLRAAQNQRATTILLDVTGVSLIDTHVAGLLVRLAQMLRLLGAHTALVGIRPEIAQSIVALGVDLTGLSSYASLMAALAAMRR